MDNKTLAAKAGVTPQQWSGIKAGRTKPSPAVIEAIDKAVSLGWRDTHKISWEQTKRAIRSVCLSADLDEAAREQARIRHGGNFSAYIGELIKSDTKGGAA